MRYLEQSHAITANFERILMGQPTGDHGAAQKYLYSLLRALQFLILGLAEWWRSGTKWAIVTLIGLVGLLLVVQGQTVHYTLSGPNGPITFTFVHAVLLIATLAALVSFWSLPSGFLGYGLSDPQLQHAIHILRDSPIGKRLDIFETYIDLGEERLKSRTRFWFALSALLWSMPWSLLLISLRTSEEDIPQADQDFIFFLFGMAFAIFFVTYCYKVASDKLVALAQFAIVAIKASE